MQIQGFLTQVHIIVKFVHQSETGFGSLCFLTVQYEIKLPQQLL